MRGLIIYLLGSLLLTILAPQLWAQAPVIPSMADIKTHLPWLQDYQEALKKAAAEKKPVLIDVTTDWCGWSKKMDRETVTTPDVQEILRRFVLVRLNPELSKENEKVSDGFGVTGFPHFIVANYKGEDIGHIEGYAEKKDFVEFIQKYGEPFKRSPLGYQSVELDPSDALFKAIKRIPAPEARPASVGSFIILDQCDVQLGTNGVAKFVTRTATFIADPEKQDLPGALQYYNSSRGKAKFKTVRVLDINGRGREVDVQLAKDEHAYDNQNVYWDARRLSLDLPSLKEGQILDVVEEQEQQPIMPGQFYFRWNTGTHMLLMSEINVTFPASLHLQKQMVRCAGEVKETKNADGTLKWTLDTSNPEPAEPEPFCPPIAESWQGCDFATPCTKDDISAWYTGLCRGRDRLPESARRKVAQIKQVNKTQKDQLQAIVNWLTKDIRYVSVSFGLSSHQPHAVTETLQNSYGDCKDQSLLLLALCHEAGIPAALVLVNAYGNGFDEANPAVEMFNHCIVEVTADGECYYLDPAAGEQTLGHISSAYSGSRALRIDGARGTVVKLPPYRPLVDQHVGETLVKLNPNGSASITQTLRYNGDLARREREKMANTTVAKVRSYLQDSYKKSGRKLLDFYMSDPDTETNIFEMRTTYAVPRFGSKGAGGYVFKMNTEDEDSNWLSLLSQPRKQPFRFYATDIGTQKFTVQLPVGATLKGQPDSLQVDTAFLKAARKVDFADNRLSVAETISYGDVRLPATASAEVLAAFQKLQDHREYSYVVQMPPMPTAP